MLEGKAGQLAQSPAYQPAPLELWRVPEAIARVTTLLAQQRQQLPLVECLPPIPAGIVQLQLRQRAALASTRARRPSSRSIMTRAPNLVAPTPRPV